MDSYSSRFLSDLRRGILDCFSGDEIRTLCTDLGIDYESLGGEGKEGKARELISHLNRRGLLSELLDYCIQARPQYPWPRRNAEEFPITQNESGSMATFRITVLFLASDPADLSRLRLGEELREIQEKLQLARFRGSFELEQRWSVRPADVSQALLDVRPQILHFSGHATSVGALCLEDQIGQTRPVAPDALAALFEQFSSQLHCVILNACYSEIQARAIAKHIDYVIGMNQAIGDKAAIAFTVGFYQALGAGRTIEDAFKLGCVQIGLQGLPEHLTPVLIKRPEESKTVPDSAPQPSMNAFQVALHPIARDTFVRFEIDAMEVMFYHAAKFGHEVGGILIGTRKQNEIHVQRTELGFKTDLSRIDLSSGEMVVGFWHSHSGIGVFLSQTDKSVMMSTPHLISVIVDTGSRGESIAAYGIVDDDFVQLRLSKG